VINPPPAAVGVLTAEHSFRCVKGCRKLTRLVAVPPVDAEE
jgi:hypothetical protein